MPSSSSFSRPSIYSPLLRKQLSRLDALINWERRNRSKALMRNTRTSTSPASVLLSRLHTSPLPFSSVHITGSKGKGTIAALLTAALRHSPHIPSPIGTYTSPHVEHISERIRLDTIPISDPLFAKSLSHVLDARARSPVIEDATWFDVLCVTGLHVFHVSKCPWTVIEVGLGGRLDSTNIISSDVCVITNLALEHANVIGPTLADIAYEKAGIIKHGSDVVLGLSESHPHAHVFVEQAERVGARSLRFCPAPGASLMEHNLMIARAAMGAVSNRLGLQINDEDLVPAHLTDVAKQMLPARMEKFRVMHEDKEVEVVLDGGHVKESVERVLDEVGFERVVVLGLGCDKDMDGICQAVGKRRPRIVLATEAGSDEIYARAETVGESMRNNGVEVEVQTDAECALERAVELAGELGVGVAVIGSLHLAGRVRPKLRRMEQGGDETLRSSVKDS